MRAGRIAWTVGLLCGLVACAPEPQLGGGSTDLHLLELWLDQGLVSLGDPQNLTDRDGYDNQPAFTADGRSVLYVRRSGSNAEIYRYDLDQKESVRVTNTGEREYSPQPLPGGDGFSVVRRERDGSQRVWRFDDQGTNPMPVVDQESVVYYCWADDDTLALYVGDDSPALYLADTKSGEIDQVAEAIGRSINPVPGRHAISFVLKESPSDWWIVELDVDTKEIRRVARALQGREDHAWTPAGSLLAARDSRLYMWTPDASDEWQEIGDFADEDIRNITRLAISPAGDHLVIVSER